MQGTTGDAKLLDIYDSKDEGQELNTETNGIAKNTSNQDTYLDQIFGKLSSNNEFDLEKNLAELDLAMDSFTGMNSITNYIDSSPKLNDQKGQSFNLLSNENQTLSDDIFSSEQHSYVNDWDAISNDTFLPSSILKQSLGDAAMGMIQKDTSKANLEDLVSTKM